MTQFGALTSFTIAELQNLQSDANRKGNGSKRSANDPGVAGRAGAPGGGYKKPGARVYVSDNGGLAHATGEKSSDAWKLIDGSTTYTPVNVPALGSWTKTGPSNDWAATGIFTIPTAHASAFASGNVALKAGRYRLVIHAAAADLSDALLRITVAGAVAGTLAQVRLAEGGTGVGSGVGLADFLIPTLTTGLALAVWKKLAGVFYVDFTVPADQNVTVTVTGVNGTDTIATISAGYLSMIVEAN